MEKPDVYDAQRVLVELERNLMRLSEKGDEIETLLDTFEDSEDEQEQKQIVAKIIANIQTMHWRDPELILVRDSFKEWRDVLIASLEDAGFNLLALKIED